MTVVMPHLLQHILRTLNGTVRVGVYSLTLQSFKIVFVYNNCRII